MLSGFPEVQTMSLTLSPGNSEESSWFFRGEEVEICFTIIFVELYLPYVF